jgi:hypothetical protein
VVTYNDVSQLQLTSAEGSFFCTDGFAFVAMFVGEVGWAPARHQRLERVRFSCLAPVKRFVSRWVGHASLQLLCLRLGTDRDGWVRSGAGLVYSRRPDMTPNEQLSGVDA